MDTPMDTRTGNMAGVGADEVKACCAAVYASDWARQLLGESFHPGGLALTRRLGMLLDLGPGKRLLDVAAGKGASAIFLAQQFGCEVIGSRCGERRVLRVCTDDRHKAGLSRLHEWRTF